MPEENKTKDSTEPADQQVNKKLPVAPTPSASDKKPSEKEVIKEETASKKEKETVSIPRPGFGNRGETRVRLS